MLSGCPGPGLVCVHTASALLWIWVSVRSLAKGVALASFIWLSFLHLVFSRLPFPFASPRFCSSPTTSLSFDFSSFILFLLRYSVPDESMADINSKYPPQICRPQKIVAGICQSEPWPRTQIIRKELLYVIYFLFDYGIWGEEGLWSRSFRSTITRRLY